MAYDMLMLCATIICAFCGLGFGSVAMYDMHTERDRRVITTLMCMIFMFSAFYFASACHVNSDEWELGHSDALNNPNYDKYESCVNYSEKCSDFEYSQVADTKKLNYCKGYIDGYEEKTKRIELETIENDIDQR